MFWKALSISVMVSVTSAVDFEGTEMIYYCRFIPKLDFVNINLVEFDISTYSEILRQFLDNVLLNEWHKYKIIFCL